jgi:hypothetical protein
MMDGPDLSNRLGYIFLWQYPYWLCIHLDKWRKVKLGSFFHLSR